jgi:tetraacyldisaccharide 4'-kinase
VRFLAERGARVALVGHAYRASPGYARVVQADDRAAIVGDEALVAARRLAGTAKVIVAPGRAAAVELAFGLADVVVLDGPLQVAPVRASLAVLVQSADAPWGSAGLCPPCGDLRASRERLLASSDLQVHLPDAEPEVHLAGEAPQSLASFAARARTRRGGGATRIGLFTALARPGRLVERLAQVGIVPQVHLEAPDHGGGRPEVLAALPRLARLHRLDLWLATDKCSSSLSFSPNAVPVAQMIPRPETVPPELASRLLAALPEGTPSPTVSTWSASAQSS